MQIKIAWSRTLSGKNFKIGKVAREWKG